VFFEFSFTKCNILYIAIENHRNLQSRRDSFSEEEVHIKAVSIVVSLILRGIDQCRIEWKFPIQHRRFLTSTRLQKFENVAPINSKYHFEVTKHIHFITVFRYATGCDILDPI